MLNLPIVQDPQVVAPIVGGFTLLLLAPRLLFPPRADASRPPPRWLGALGLGMFLTGTQLLWDGLP